MADGSRIGMDGPVVSGKLRRVRRDVHGCRHHYGRDRQGSLPSPFFSTVIQCGLLVLEGGTDKQKKELLSKISEGSLIMALAQYEAETDYSYESITMTAEPEARGYVLNGTKLFAMDANVADKLIVVAHAGTKGLSLFIVNAHVPGVTITKLPYVSSENACQVVFKDVQVENADLLGSPGQCSVNAGQNVCKSGRGKSCGDVWRL